MTFVYKKKMKKGLFGFRDIILKQQILLGRFLASCGASEYTILIIYSIIMGTIAGFAAIGFHKTIILFSKATAFSAGLFKPGYGFFIILIPTLGMFIQWVMTRIAPRQAKQRGVLEVIKAVSLRDGEIPFKATLFQFLATTICIGSGGTVGPEAPAAQTGAGVVSAAGKILGLSVSRLRMFTAAGAGAAIAGVFNTPLAGIFFSLEVVLLNEFRTTTLSIFLLSTVSASAVSRIFLGNAPKFHFDSLQMGPYSHFIFYLLLGVLAGLLSILFIRTKEYTWHKFAAYYKKHTLLPGMLAAGLLMGLAGYLMPQIFGIGYETINDILVDHVAVPDMLVLFLLKFSLVIIILCAGGYGGVFAPSLFMGACFGSLFAHLVSILFHIPLDPATFALVGMGAMLAGINSIPITAIMMLFELTNNYMFVLPLMLGIVGSHTITQLFLNGSVYRKELANEGYRISDGQETTILQSVSVDKIARADISTISEKTPITELVRQFLSRDHDTIYTINDDGRLTGVITSSTLRHLITSYHDLHGVVIASDIADYDFVSINANDTLDKAMQLFARHHVEEIPVMSKVETEQIIGVLHYQDVLHVYNQKIGKLSIQDELATNMKNIDKYKAMEAIPGFSVAEIAVPDKFISKTLAQLDLRNLYKIDVLVVERPEQITAKSSENLKILPDKNFCLSRGDILVIYGYSADVERFRINIQSV